MIEDFEVGKVRNYNQLKQNKVNMLAIRFVAIQKTVARNKSYNWNTRCSSSGYDTTYKRDGHYHSTYPAKDWRKECLDAMEAEEPKCADDHEEAQPQDVDNAPWEDP